jgi:hypothetical protein
VPQHWFPRSNRKRAKAWRAKAASLFEDQRERSLCLDLAQGYERLADQLELRSKLDRMRPFVTQNSSSDRA